MANAEAFRRQFESDVATGTPIRAVEEYLARKGLKLDGGTFLRMRSGTSDMWLELSREESPNWYCGKGSVGLAVYFVDYKLDRTEVTYWSFDCP
ncbi:MAG TPA: hypothetical protein VFA59_03310 [Vicinamibacterales bacterium]|nr:hypothetical protein [Vicinamibacterales bacterium]